MGRGILLRRLLCSRRSRRLETSSGIGGLATGATSRVAGASSRVAAASSRVVQVGMVRVAGVSSRVALVGMVRVAAASSRVVLGVMVVLVGSLVGTAGTARVVAGVSSLVAQAGKVSRVSRATEATVSRGILRRLLPCRRLLLFQHQLALLCRRLLLFLLRLPPFRRLRRLRLRRLCRLGMASLVSRLWGSSQVLHSLRLRVCWLLGIGLLRSMAITISRPLVGIAPISRG